MGAGDIPSDHWSHRTCSGATVHFNPLDLHNPESNTPVDLIRFVRRLRTLLVVGPDVAIDGKTVPRLHKSFFEFIAGEHADSRFRISPELHNSQLTLRCFKVMEFSPRRNMAKETLLLEVQYACRHWASHLSFAPFGNSELRGLEDFTLHRLLWWLEVMCLLNSIQDACTSMKVALAWTVSIQT
jgi:hypothetical protein